MRRTYRYSGLELDVLWRSVHERPLPPPLVYLAEPTEPSVYERKRYEARERLRDTVDERLRHSLATFADADITVLLWSTPGIDDPTQIIRRAGARAGAHGCVLEQMPGTDFWGNRGFLVTECDAVGLGPAMTAGLPTAEPGRRGEFVLATVDSDIDFSLRGRRVLREVDDSQWYRSNRFLKAAVTRFGTVRTIHGTHDADGTALTLQFGWRDLVDDGRYAVLPGPPSVARSVGPDGLARLVDNDIARVVEVIRSGRD